MNKGSLESIDRQSAFSRALHSIRTRFSLMTAVFILLALAAFYIGGRIVLVHLVRDTEQQVAEGGLTSARAGRVSSAAPPAYGLTPMLSEALDYYSGGYWQLRRGRKGEALTGVTSVAMGRLAFFIAIGGILFVLPLFWFQGRLLLNPLSRMTREIAELGKHNADIDCPRLEWEGKDEFALLALSVNRMLETISARSISIAQAELRHQALIDGLPDSLAIFDPDGRLVALTKEADGVPKLPGLEPGEPPAAAVFGKESVDDFVRILDRTFHTGKVGKLRMKVQRPIGVPRSVPTRHFELRLVRMDEYFVMVVIRDVTEEVAEHKLRLAAEERLSDTKKRASLTLLAAGIAHDMNNVLSVVLSAAESAGSDPAGGYQQALQTVRDAVRRGSSMMRELVTFAGENKIALLPVDPNLVLNDVKLLAERVAGRNVIVSYSPGADLPRVDADPNQFWKVLFNIIKNASEAIGSRPGRIMLSTERFEMTEEQAVRFLSAKPLERGVGVVFRIEDDGPGIRPEILSRLFDPFVSSKDVGRGLGLATVRTIIEAHGGGISVSSVIDRGTSFDIFLPQSRLPAESRIVGGADGNERAVAAELSGDVLVVDDDEAICRTTSILLRGLKVTPHVAKDGQEALAVVRRYTNRLRAIVLDADLGGVDTVRLLGAFRVSAPDVPVIVSTGSGEEAIRKLFASTMYDAFLAKPYTLDELRTSIATLRRNMV